jgi:hypothetical protein
MKKKEKKDSREFLWGKNISQNLIKRENAKRHCENIFRPSSEETTREKKNNEQYDQRGEGMMFFLQCLTCVIIAQDQKKVIKKGEKMTRTCFDQRTELACLSNSFGLLSESSCSLSCSRRRGSVSSGRAAVEVDGRPLFIDCASEASLSHFSCLAFLT